MDLFITLYGTLLTDLLMQVLLDIQIIVVGAFSVAFILLLAVVLVGKWLHALRPDGEGE